MTAEVGYNSSDLLKGKLTDKGLFLTPSRPVRKNGRGEKMAGRLRKYHLFGERR